MIVIVILTFAAAGVLSYSVTTYRNSVRQALLDQAKEVADSEMEYLFYCWKSAILAKNAVAQISCVNPTTLAANPSSPLVIAGICGTDMTMTEPAFNSTEANWSISRMVNFNPIGSLLTSDGSATGLVQAGSQQTGHNYYFSAEVSATLNSTSLNALVGSLTYHSGRHFEYTSNSLFQYAVFYQGNLEIAAGGNMKIGGPLSTNASAYMGSQTGYSLTITDIASYYQDYNGAADPLSGETQRLEGTGALSDPVYNPNPLDAAPTDQSAQRAIQVTKMSSQMSFIAGVDVASDIVTYPTAYNDDPNEIYRAVIAPPPTDSLGNPIPEDPVVASNRMYNSAALVITINQAAPASTPTVDVGTAADPTAYDSTFPAATVLTGGSQPIVSSVRTAITDPREELAGASGVYVTSVDVGALNTALTQPGGALATNSALAAAYNGVVYIYDDTNPTTVGQPNSINAILLKNATTTPDVNDQNGNPIGFTVVSNNGVYVQGDYNTTQIIAGGASVNNPAAIMGDAITVLSQGWTPAEANTSTAIASRQATVSAPTGANGVNPASTGTADGMTVNAAILTGNTPSTTTTNSGGVQNLVRMIEDWYDPNGALGLTLELDGSLGQLFTSKYFKGPYLGNGIQAGLPAANDRIYLQPKTRNFDYDTGFKARTPAGAPTTSGFYRGDFFFW
jgi:hypothetical protein